MTSDGGDEGWTFNPHQRANTTDGTPQVTFSTTTAGNCSFANSVEYDQSKICGTSEETDHICTLTFADRLSYGSSNVYASCVNTLGDAWYNSSALPINMTAGSGDDGGLVACLSVLGAGCSAVVTDGCADITT